MGIQYSAYIFLPTSKPLEKPHKTIVDEHRASERREAAAMKPSAKAIGLMSI